MIKSLLLKLGLLVVTTAVVFGIRWVPQPSVQGLPSVTEKQVVAQAESARTAVHSRLDLNRASAGELESLPGIGAVTAQRMIAFRESAGGFRTVEDLREIKGIGAKKFDRLKPLVTVSTGGSKRETERREL